MSEENVEIIKRSIAAFNREDWDAFYRDMAPEFELDMSRAIGPVSGIFKLDQLRQAVVEFRQLWDHIRFEPHEFIEAGDLVVVPWTMHVTGRDGIEVESNPTFVWTIRGGAIERVSMYQGRGEALDAVGLSDG